MYLDTSIMTHAMLVSSSCSVKQREAERYPPRICCTVICQALLMGYLGNQSNWSNPNGTFG
jgi:hypothetical protein